MNKMLSIEIKLSTSFNLQTDSQTEKMNQEGKDKWKDDRVCGENKESAERSRSSIKKGTKKMKQQVDKRRREVKEWEKSNMIMLSIYHMSSLSIQKMFLQW